MCRQLPFLFLKNVGNAHELQTEAAFFAVSDSEAGAFAVCMADTHFLHDPRLTAKLADLWLA